MMFVWLLVSSGWRYWSDTVLMQRRIRGNNLYMCEQYGVDGKLYVGVMMSSCFMAKSGNGWQHRHAQQEALRRKTVMFTVWRWDWVTVICRRTSLKYQAWKWIKTVDFLLDWQLGSMRLVMIHKYSRPHTFIYRYESLKTPLATPTQRRPGIEIFTRCDAPNNPSRFNRSSHC